MIDLCNNCSVDSVLQTFNSYHTYTNFLDVVRIDILSIYSGIHAMSMLISLFCLVYRLLHFILFYVSYKGILSMTANDIN